MTITPIMVQTRWKPTGEFRLRPNWFGGVVAELEEQCEYGPAMLQGPATTSTIYRWRRARAADCILPITPKEKD